MAALTFDDILGETPPVSPQSAPSSSKAGPRLRGPISFDDLLAASPAQDPSEPSTADYIWDVVRSAPSDVAKLVAETIGSPLSIARLDSIESPPEDLPWYRQTLPQLLGYEEYAKPARKALAGGQDAVRAAIEENLPQPQYMPGKIAEEGLQWIGPAAWPTKATRMATGTAKVGNYIMDLTAHGAAPWAAYEAANAYGGPGVGAAAALATGLGLGAGRTARSPQAVVRRETAAMSPEEWIKSIEMQDTAKSRFGIDLSGAEAIAQATDQPNAPILKSLRLSEAHPSGAAVTGPFFRQREGQVDAALESALGDIAPSPAAPQNIGAKVQKAAKDVIKDAEKRINEQTKPLYQAAELDQIDPQDYAALTADPAYADALKRLRGDSILGKKLHNYPDNSIEVIDTVVQDLIARGEAAAVKGEGYQPHIGGLQTGAAQTARNAASKASPNYAQALAEQHQFRQGELTDLESGPVGDLSKVSSTDAVTRALLPGAPTAATTSALVDAITRIRATGQEMLPAVRHGLDRILSSISSGTLGGDRTRVGPKFAQLIAGSPQRKAGLDAVLAASGAPVQGVQAFGDLLPMLQAMGKRLTEGSPTAQLNAQMADLSTGPVLDAALAGAQGSLAPLFTGGLKDYILRGNVENLANLTTGSVRNMKAASEQAWKNLVPDVLSRTGLSSLFAVNRE